MSVIVPRADRVPLPISLTYRVAGDDHWLQSRVANMSESGVLFGPTNLEVGARVEMIIASPIRVGTTEPGRVVCLAQVVRTTEWGTAAVRFDGCRFLVES